MGKSINGISILYPTGYINGYKEISDITIHDLGIDVLVKKIAGKEVEQQLILRVLKKMTPDPAVTKYRADVFMDIYNNPKMQEELMEIMDKINFLRDYGSLKREFDESAGTWDLLHRLDEIKDYIVCVEAIHKCLSDVNIESEGLIRLKDYVKSLYEEKGFDELKKDIAELKVTTSNLRSVTLGINLNDRFEAESMGLVSINSKSFTKSNLISNFCDFVSTKDRIADSQEWDNNYKYQPITPNMVNTQGALEHFGRATAVMANPILAGIAAIPSGDSAQDSTRYIERMADHMLSIMVKKLREVLKKYVTVTITDITNLIPEFIFYSRFAEYVNDLKSRGMHFCKPELSDNKDMLMSAKGVYNLKLTEVASTFDDIVTNDLVFDSEKLVYILTGANRGGKTTITQAVGILYVLAQAGIYVPGDGFTFSPVDGIYTHFPADEDKTLDLGRLGEECKRFKEMYQDSTSNSLLLLNETFSTTSFEEGYYIAKDSVKAILNKGVRTIYNTHMHKLAYDINELNEISGKGKAASLVVKSESGKRSFKVEVAPPEGMSYAKDIAEKYGVTYEMLTK